MIFGFLQNAEADVKYMDVLHTALGEFRLLEYDSSLPAYINSTDPNRNIAGRKKP